jgi:hypothetical protein
MNYFVYCYLFISSKKNAETYPCIKVFGEDDVSAYPYQPRY